MSARLDLLIVSAPGKRRVYQGLADDLAAFEPPIWASLIAGYSRKHGLSVRILDAEALLLTFEDTVKEIVSCNPRLTVFAVYGQQPSASTQCMPAASAVCSLLKDTAPELKTLFLGTHPSALPARTLLEEKTDFVCEGEGPLTIRNLIEALKSPSPDLTKIRGLWFREDGKPRGNPPEQQFGDLDAELGTMSWDLLPMDRYRAHNWHCWDHINARKPYASLYTSLGCPFSCTFCCINAPFGGAGIRYFSPERVAGEIDILVEKYGVKNIKFADEMYVLNQRHVIGIADLLIERGYDLNIWAYARVDTVKDQYLEKLRKAGFRWLGIGVESASKFVRDGIEKGRFGNEDIAKVIGKIREWDINVGANYIFGLPDDTRESMEQTLELALTLNTEYANFYSAMAYPGSPLHRIAVEKKLPLPEDGPGWIGYSQHAAECLPLPTETLQGGQVLTFRDRAFTRYFTNPAYLEMIGRRFGGEVVKHLGYMSGHVLERRFCLPV